MQVLTGDTCDGYSGCPGIGKKKAEKILNEAIDSYSGDFVTKEEFIWSFIIPAYLSKGLSEEDALTQARVARILRKDDYDFKKGEVKLWSPN
jgi:DNA polymerase-1